jgi:hypothetical protein
MARDALVRPLQDTLVRHEESSSLLAARQTALYRDFVTQRQQQQQQLQAAVAERDASAAAAEVLGAKVRTMEESLRVIDSATAAGGDAQRAQLTDHVRALTRRLARFEANEATLGRRYNLLKQEVCPGMGLLSLSVVAVLLWRRVGG